MITKDINTELLELFTNFVEVNNDITFTSFSCVFGTTYYFVKPPYALKLEVNEYHSHLTDKDVKIVTHSWYRLKDSYRGDTTSLTFHLNYDRLCDCTAIESVLETNKEIMDIVLTRFKYLPRLDEQVTVNHEFIKATDVDSSGPLIYLGIEHEYVSVDDIFERYQSIYQKLQLAKMVLLDPSKIAKKYFNTNKLFKDAEGNYDEVSVEAICHELRYIGGDGVISPLIIVLYDGYRLDVCLKTDTAFKIEFSCKTFDSILANFKLNEYFNNLLTRPYKLTKLRRTALLMHLRRKLDVPIESYLDRDHVDVGPFKIEVDYLVGDRLFKYDVYWTGKCLNDDGFLFSTDNIDEINTFINQFDNLIPLSYYEEDEDSLDELLIPTYFASDAFWFYHCNDVEMKAALGADLNRSNGELTIHTSLFDWQTKQWKAVSKNINQDFEDELPF